MIMLNNTAKNVVCYQFEITKLSLLFFYSYLDLADASIQSDLQWIQAIHIFSMCSLGIEPTTFCTANTMLYH